MVKILAVCKTDPFWKALEFSLMPYFIVQVSINECQNMLKSPELYLAPTRIPNYFTNEQSLCHDSPKIHNDGIFRCNLLNMNGLYSLILFPGRQGGKKRNGE